MKNILIFLLALTMAACQAPYAEQTLTDRFIETDRLSSQKVTDFAEDSRGYVWIGTQRGLSRFNGQTYHRYFAQTDSLKEYYFDVNCLLTDKQENLWVGTINGLYRYRYGTGMTKVNDNYITMISDVSSDYLICGSYTYVLCVNKHTLDTFPCYDFNTDNRRNRFLTDSHGRLWIFEGKNIKCVEIQSGHIEDEFTAESEVRFALALGKDIYVATETEISLLDTEGKRIYKPFFMQKMAAALRGESIQKTFAYDDKSFLIYTGLRHIYHYDTVTRKLTRNDSPNFPFDVPSSELSNVFVDSRKNVWIGMRWSGYSIAYNRQISFNRNFHFTSQFKGKSISDLHVDHKGNLWIIVDKRNLYLCDRNYNASLVYTYDIGDIDHVCVDSEDNVWLTTPDRVYYGRLAGGRYIVSGEQEIFSLSIGASKEGVYVGAVGKVYSKLKGETSLKAIGTGEVNYYNIIKLLPLESGEIAMLDVNKGIYFVDGKTIKPEHYDLSGYLNKKKGFLDFCLDRHGRYWVTSAGEGIFCVDSKTGEVKHYDTDEYCHDACSIVEDYAGHIWIGTYDGLTHLNPDTVDFTTFYEEDEIAGNEFSDQCAAKINGGSLIFGGMKGLTLFSLEELPHSKKVTLQLEYLTVGENHIQDLMTNSKVNLSHDNAGLNFSFTTLNFGGSAPTCQYKMEGFDPKWNTVRGSEHAYYSHLPVGEYVLRIHTVGNMDSDVERTVTVKVHPSFWGLPVMKWLVYPLVTILLLATLVYWVYRRQLTMRCLKTVTLEKEQEQRANELNMRFFSNISHEFRTPLTLINGALSMMKAEGENRYVGIMRRNTDRMLRMVGQLMDFNKMENGMLKLNVTETDVNQLAAQIVAMFEVTAENKHISLSLSPLKPPRSALLDIDKFEKILVNLISNAIKYSGDGSSVTVSLSMVDDQLQVDVADTGVGIPEEKREEIFLRFYQLKQTGQVPNLGTGIGLYYTKCLVELHHGWIRCLNNEPHGSVFRFVIPMNVGAYERNELFLIRSSLQGYTVPACGQVHDLPLQGDVSGEEIKVGPTLMLVDDDPEILNFLQMLLSPHYQIHAYSDAAKAYQEIENVKPELILSDVMMEEIDGYKFCRMIKDNSTTCHIPVLLLTAKTAIEEQIQGLNCGASAYITKPFSTEYLLAMIKTQLDNVRNIRQALYESTEITPEVENSLQGADLKFMETFYGYIEEHISDAELKL